MTLKKSVFTSIVFFTIQVNLVAQNGTRLIGYDARSIGRGGTTTGFFSGNTSLQTNPAGIAFHEKNELDLGIGILAPSLHFKNAVNDANGKSNAYPLPNVSYVHAAGKKINYGFGVFTEGGLGADYQLNHALYKDQSGNFVKQNYHSKFAVLQAGGSFSYKLSEKFAVGGTAQLVYSQLELAAPLSLPPSVLQGVIDPQSGYTFGQFFSAAPANNGLGYTELTGLASIDGLKAWRFSGKLGIAYKPSENFSFGVNYTSATTLTFKNGNASLDLTGQFNDAFARVVAGIIQQNPGTTPAQAQQQAAQQFTQLGVDLSKGVTDKYAATAKLRLPQTIAAGVSFAVDKSLRLAVDAEWINWAKAFKTLDIDLSGGSNSNINRLLGTSGKIHFPFPLNWKNTLVLRTGAEYLASKLLTLRAGYVYGSNPVPTSTVFAVFPAVVKHHATIGAGVRLSGSSVLNLAYEHAFRSQQTAASSSLVGSQYNSSVSSLATDAYHLSFVLQLK